MVKGALTDPQIEELVQSYVTRMARYEEVAALVENRLRRELRGNAIRAMLSSRAKHPDDVREKLTRKRADSRYAFADLALRMDEILIDLAGCRITVYRLADENKAKRVVESAFGLASIANNSEVHRKPSGYRATHLLVQVSEEEERLSLRRAICEVQIAPFGAHVFNELEHDVAYKDHDLPPTPAEKEALADLAAAGRLLDRAAEQLMLERAEAVVRQTVALDSAEELQLVLERRAGRKLHGEFTRLYRFLNTVLQPLTAAAVERIGDFSALCARGRERAHELGISEELDDVATYALALVDQFRPELSEFVRSQRGRSTLLKRVVERAMEDK